MRITVEPLNPPASDVADPSLLTSYDAVTLHVRVPEEDPTTEQAMAIVEASGTLDFWDHPEEDVYDARQNR